MLQKKKKRVKTHIIPLIRPFLLILFTLSGTCEYAFLQSTHSFFKNLCLWGCTLYFVDRLILAVYRWIEEHNLDSKPRLVGVVASPLRFPRCSAVDVPSLRRSVSFAMQFLYFVAASGLMSVVPIASPLSLVDGVVFAGQSDVLSASWFLAVVFFFVARAELQVGVLAPQVFRW